MRKFLIAAALISTAATAAPALAQPGYGHARPVWNFGGPTRAQIADLLRDLNRAENGIQRSVQRRVISPREAVGLRADASRIRVRLNLASRNGINNREFAGLRAQVNQLEQRLRLERRDNDRRPY